MKEPALHTASGARIPLLTVAEAAAYLRLTEKALRRRIARFEQDPVKYYLPVRRIGGSIRFMASELDAWTVADRRARLRVA